MRITFYSFLTAFILFASTGCSRLFTSKPPVTLTQAWASENSLKTPESVVFDPQRNVLYVTNLNQKGNGRKDGDGFVSILTPQGAIQQLFWTTGLNDPKGIALHNNVLYVADMDEIVAIATQSGAVLGKYKAENAQDLNDVTIDQSGNVYVSDSETKRIYMLSNGRVSTWLENTDNEKPNGLLHEENRMIVTLMSNGTVHFLDPERKKFNKWVDEIPHADGIAADGRGGYFISSWNGEIYYIDQKNKKFKLLDTKEQKMNTADISYSQQQQLLFVPTFYDNRVVAYRVGY